MKIIFKTFFTLIFLNIKLYSQTPPTSETLQTTQFTQTSNPPVINVIYPKEEQIVNAKDSTFIIGNVTPRSELKINGFPVKVYGNGAFLGFIPLTPGNFIFELIATNEGGTTIRTLAVKVPLPVIPTPPDSFRIEPAGKLPDVNMLLTFGDLIQVKFRGTPKHKAFFKIENLTEWLPMLETQVKTESMSGNFVFGSGQFSDSLMSDSLLSEGIYSGSYLIKPTDKIDSARIFFQLVKSMAVEKDSLEKFLAVNKMIKTGCPDTVNFSICVVDSASARLAVVQWDIPQIVELTDTTQIARTGPNLGYSLLFQPQGVKAVATAKIGTWVRLKLSETEVAWVAEEKIKYLPSGTPIPQSSISFIKNESTSDKTKLIFNLSEKLPFRVEQSTNPPALTLTIYYATSNVNFIRYDAKRKFIENIQWMQPEKRVFQLKVLLRLKQQWGYDVYYEKDNLILEINRAPKWAGDLSGLKICVDAGHSEDNGAIGPTGLLEKEVNLQIAKKVKTLLENHGAKVTMTRNGMEHVPLYHRPKVALESKADIFISIHNNSHPDGINPMVYNGTSIYYYHPQSELLAEKIHKYLLSNLGLPDQGLYHANFAVLRSPQYLSVLVECAFIIVPEQEMLLRTEIFQNKVARAIYLGLMEFLQTAR